MGPLDLRAEPGVSDTSRWICGMVPRPRSVSYYRQEASRNPCNIAVSLLGYMDIFT